MAVGRLRKRRVSMAQAFLYQRAAGARAAQAQRKPCVSLGISIVRKAWLAEGGVSSAQVLAQARKMLIGNAGARKVAQAARKHGARRILARVRSRKIRVRIARSKNCFSIKVLFLFFADWDGRETSHGKDYPADAISFRNSEKSA